MLKHTIGTYPDISLRDARARSTALRATIQAGNDPQIAKRLARLPVSTSVTECFELYLCDDLKLHLKSWPEYERVMRRDVLPFIGKTELKHLIRRQSTL